MWRALPAIGLPSEHMETTALRKSDPRNAVVANLLWKRTAVSTGWNVEWLAMGHARTDNRLAKAVASREPILRELGRIVGAG